MLLALLAALLVALVVLLAAGRSSQAIVDGSQVEPQGKYPFMVALLWKWQFGQPPHKYLYCGGTLIDKNSVLTAAHCLEGTSVGDGNLDIIVGATGLGVGQGVVRDAKGIVVHPSYYSSKPTHRSYDVGIITLNQPVTNRTPIQLATANQNGLEKEGSKATVAGWGKTTRGSGKAVGWLREAEVTIKGDKYGGEAYNNPDAYPPSLLIAAGTFAKGPTKGDSGGPLFTRDNSGQYTQIGVSSRGFEHAGCALEPVIKCPGVYVEVNNPSIRSFIINQASRF
jgi:secreted trypsin-like serine protease